MPSAGKRKGGQAPPSDTDIHAGRAENPYVPPLQWILNHVFGFTREFGRRLPPDVQAFLIDNAPNFPYGQPGEKVPRDSDEHEAYKRHHKALVTIFRDVVTAVCRHCEWDYWAALRCANQNPGSFRYRHDKPASGPLVMPADKAHMQIKLPADVRHYALRIMLGISAFSNPDEMRDEELVADIIDKCKAGDFEHPIEQRFLNLIWSPLEKLYLAGYQKQARDAKAAIDEKKAVANFKDLETAITEAVQSLPFDVKAVDAISEKARSFVSRLRSFEIQLGAATPHGVDRTRRAMDIALQKADHAVRLHFTKLGGVRPAVLRQPSNTTDAVDPEVKPSFGFDLFDGCSDRVLHEYLGITFPLCPPTDSNSDRPLAPKYSQLQGVCRLVGHAYLDEQPDGHWGSDLLVDAEHSDTILLGDATGMGKTGTVAMTFRVLGEMAVQQRSALVNGGFPVSMMRSRRGLDMTSVQSLRNSSGLVGTFAQTGRLFPSTAPRLVVCTLTAIGQWHSELRRFDPLRSVYIVRKAKEYAGVRISIDKAREECPVILMPYGILTQLMAEQCPGQISPFGARWSIAVFDEAHTCRNSSKRHAACHLLSLSADYRILLTATSFFSSILDIGMILRAGGLATVESLGHAESHKRPEYAEMIRKSEDRDARARREVTRSDAAKYNHTRLATRVRRALRDPPVATIERGQGEIDPQDVLFGKIGCCIAYRTKDARDPDGHMMLSVGNLIRTVEYVPLGKDEAAYARSAIAQYAIDNGISNDSLGRFGPFYHLGCRITVCPWVAYQYIGLPGSHYIPAKLERVRDIIHEIQAADAEEEDKVKRKVMIYWRYVDDFDLIVAMLKQHGIEVLALSGKTKPKDRDLHIADVNRDEDHNISTTSVGNQKSRVVLVSSVMGESMNFHRVDVLIMLSPANTPAEEMQVEGRFHRPNTLGRISVRGSKRVIVLTSPDTADEPGWRALGARTVSQAEAFARLHDVPDATSLYEEADLRAPRKKRVHFDADDADINENQEAADEHWRVLGVLSIVQSIRTRSSIQHQVTGIKASYIGGSSTRVEGANPGLQVAEFYFGDCDRREGFDQEPAHLLSDEVPVLGRRQDARLTTLNIARQRGAELRQHAPQDVAEREEAIARVQEEQEYCERFEGLREADLEYIWKSKDFALPNDKLQCLSQVEEIFELVTRTVGQVARTEWSSIDLQKYKTLAEVLPAMTVNLQKTAARLEHAGEMLPDLPRTWQDWPSWIWFDPREYPKRVWRREGEHCLDDESTPRPPYPRPVFQGGRYIDRRRQEDTQEEPSDMPTTPSPQRNSSSDRADSHPPSELPRSATATPPSSRSSPMHERWRTYGDGNRNIDTSGDGLFVSVEDNWDDGIELDLDPARVSPEPSESSLQSAVGAIRKRKVDDRHQARRQSDLALDSEVQQASCHQGRQRISQAGMFGQINALNTAYVPDCAQNRREAAQADSTLIRKKSRLPSRHEAPARPTRPNTGAYPMPQTVYSRADDTRFLNHGREQWDHTRPDVVPRRLPAQAAESTPVSLDTHTIRRPQGPVGRRQEDLFVPTPTAATTGPMGWTSIQPAPMRR